MSLSHAVEIVPFKMEPHPGADSLSLVKVHGYVCAVKTDAPEWRNATVAAYIPPDSIVYADRPEFTFLLDKAKWKNGERPEVRIKAKKLRGIVSFGLLVPAPANVKLGDDVAELLEVKHYNPPEPNEGRGGFYMGGESATPPDIYTVKYDLENFRRYHEVFVPGESVVITEKVDGSACRYVYWDGKLHCGSRNEWKREYPCYEHVTLEKLVAAGKTEEEAREIIDRLHSKKKRNLWWELLDKYPTIEEFCRANPGVVLHGEVFGNINCIKYSLPEGNRFAAFDLMKDGQWLDPLVARDLTYQCNKDFPWVPMLSCLSGYNFEECCALAEGPTTVSDAKPGTIREGCVIEPLVVRHDHKLGRVKLKCVSGAFLERFH